MNKMFPGLVLLKTIDKYFSNTGYDTVIMLLLLVCPAIVTTVYLFFGRQTGPKIRIGSPEVYRKNMDFFEIVRLQKGLEEFDRDFLIETAENYGCFPPYNILIEQEACMQVEKAILQDLSDKKIEPEKDKKYQHFIRLKSRLFK